MYDSKWCRRNSVQERGKHFGREQWTIHKHIADHSRSHEGLPCKSDTKTSTKKLKLKQPWNLTIKKFLQTAGRYHNIAKFWTKDVLAQLITDT